MAVARAGNGGSGADLPFEIFGRKLGEFDCSRLGAAALTLSYLS